MIIGTTTGYGGTGSYILEDYFDSSGTVTISAKMYGAVVKARILSPGTTLEVTEVVRGVVSSGQSIKGIAGLTLSVDGTSDEGIATASVSFDGNVLIVHSILSNVLSVGLEVKGTNNTILIGTSSNSTAVFIDGTITGSGGVGNYTLSSNVPTAAHEIFEVSIHHTGTGGIGTYGLSESKSPFSTPAEYKMTYTGTGGIGTYGLTTHQAKHTENMNVVQVVEGSYGDRRTACFTIIDLATLNSRAKGFKRGFVGYPYIYLTPGQYNVGARLDMESPRIDKVSVVDLLEVGKSYGGYSGGFEDRGWACFNPARTFAGPAGGLRSDLLVDLNTLRAYYHGEVVCVGKDAWDRTKNLTDTETFISFDLSTIEPNLRGFSESVRVGRFVYFAPLSSTPFDYSSKMIRLDLGETSVYQMYVDMKARGGVIKDQCVILDLSQANPNLLGFGGIVQHGRFLILSPFRNSYEPANGNFYSLTFFVHFSLHSILCFDDSLIHTYSIYMLILIHNCFCTLSVVPR